MFDPCPHCQPYSEYTHIDDYISSFIGSISIKFSSGNNQNYTGWLWLKLLLLLKKVGVVDLVSNPKRNKLYNRGLIFFDEAKQRGIDIRAVTIFGIYVHEYVYKLKEDDSYKFFSQLPCPRPYPSSKIDNKVWTKQTLESKGFPVSKGKSFYLKQAGLQYGNNIGYPLVVKPTQGSLSKHVTTSIANKKELEEAIDIAKKFSAQYIVESHLPGNLYRATVVNCKYVFVCQKRRPNIVGDGRRTIKQLIKDKNGNQCRGKTNQKNSTLHIINIDRSQKFLKDSEYTLKSIPNKNEQVFLSNMNTLAAGCDIIEYTNSTHEDTKQMLRQAADTLSVGLVGFDFICDDISVSWQNQKCGIIEANTKPYADMHAYPSEGISQPIAQTVWNALLDNQSANM